MKRPGFNTLLRYAFFLYLISVPLSLGLSDAGIFLVLFISLKLYVEGSRSYTFPRLKVMRSFMLFLLATFFSVILSAHKLHSLFSLKELRPFFLLLTVPFFAGTENKLEDDLESIAVLLLSVAVFFSGIQFILQSKVRLLEKFVSEGHLTLMCMQTIIFSVSFLDLKAGVTGRFTYFKRILFILVFLLSYVDANVPFFITLCTISLLRYFISPSKKTLLLWAVPLIFAIIFGLAGKHSDNFLFHLLPGYKNVLITEARNFSRVDPVFGNGYDTFSVLNSLREKRAYSDVLTAYVNTGALGMTALLIFLFDMLLLAVRIRNGNRKVGDGAFIFLLLFLLMSFFNPMFFTPHGLRYLVSVWLTLETADLVSFYRKSV